MHIAIDQSLSLLIRHLEIKRFACEDERIVNNAEKVAVPLGGGAQPCIFELSGSPYVGQFRSAARKELFGHCKNGARVKNRKAIKGDCSDSRLRIGGGICRGQYCGSRDGAGGNFQEFTTVDRHGIISREDKSVGPPASRYARREALAGGRCGTSCSRSSDAGLSTGGLAGKCLPEPGEIAGVDIGDSAKCQAARTPGFHAVAVTWRRGSRRCRRSVHGCRPD